MPNITPHEYETKDDFGMVRGLLRRGPYQIPDRLREKIISSAERVIDNLDIDPKIMLSAAKLMVDCDRINVEMIKLAIPKKIETFNARGATDAQLLEAIQKTTKLLPRIIEHGEDSRGPDPDAVSIIKES